ncbi:MAG: hypothetical protein HKN43_07715 [Rhodothermales bacterium]|nr:hypothetical protein [Rhodothermales bacterium]
MPVRTLALVCLVVLASCDTADLQNDFLEEARRAPSGVTVTNANGAIISVDDDDWRTAPLFTGKVIVEPAYPNPVSGGLVTLPIRILQFDDVTGGLFVRAFNGSNQLITLAEALDTSSPGVYTISINPGLLSAVGLHRLFLQDFLGEIVSYGDLRIE